MRIAFYAPMKPVSSPVPSGDRQMARNLIAALECGHEVEIASEFVSRDGSGDAAIQRALARRAQEEASVLIEKWRGGDPQRRPEAWFTYHVYHKAPDWIGPAISEALEIPYFMAEVSHAPKQAGGPWDIGYRAAEAAIKHGQGIIGLSQRDAACVLPLLEDPGRYHTLPPFTDTTPFALAAKNRIKHRADIAGRFQLDGNTPILLAVGMTREGDKLASYRVLAEALGRLQNSKWALLIVGDGPARSSVEAAFADLAGNRVRFAGGVMPEELPALYAAADLMVWPAVNEAYGMAMLEAQATGLPVVAGETGGVPDFVKHGETGLLCLVGDAGAFAAAAAELLAAPDRRAVFSMKALARTASEHDITSAAVALDRILRDARELGAV
ncbi:MAG: glycosyltransferase family 4 protein [Pseudomonadota bacterium]|nr:glycosyltransferase family 4 protein [Pseudomonadota bacterium]